MQLFTKFKRTVEESSDDENIRSWVLFALRETMEQQTIRNNVLKYFLDDQFKYYGYKPVYGKTLNNRKTEKPLITYLTKMMSQYQPDPKSKNVIMFTVSNLYDEDTHETHFQTFVYIPGYTTGPVIFCFDPSRTCEQAEGIYSPHAVDEINTIVQNLNPNIRLLYPIVADACQIHENDVFCQSWSLYLQIQGVSRFLQRGDLNYAADIPSHQFEKYMVLLNFYKIILPLICKTLQKTYNKLADIPKKYVHIDPCERISEMQCTFANDLVNCSLCGPPQDKSAACPEILLQSRKSRKSQTSRMQQFNSRRSRQVRNRSRSVQSRSRQHRVHSKPRYTKKLPSKMSGSSTSRHHSGKKSHVKHATKPIVQHPTKPVEKRVLSTQLKPAGRGLARSRQIAKEKHKEMDKILDSLGNMKLSNKAHKDVIKLDKLLQSMRDLKIDKKSRKVRFAFDKEGIEHTAAKLRERQGEQQYLANCLEQLYRIATTRQISDQARLQLNNVIDNIIHAVEDGTPLSANTIAVCRRYRPDDSSDDSSDESDEEDDDEDDESSGEESSASDTTPPTTANSAWQSGSGTNLDDTLWSRQPTQTSGQNPAHLGWNITD
jgi:hypothetical protein